MRICFYGMGKEGRAFYNKYKAKGILPDILVDRSDNIRHIDGMEVVGPEFIFENKCEQVLAVISTDKYYDDIYNGLRQYYHIYAISMDYYDYLTNASDSINQATIDEIEQNYWESLKTFVDSHDRLLLFADRGILQPDTNAGSRSSMSYLNEIIELGWGVLFLPIDLKYIEDYKESIQNMNCFVLFGKHRRDKIYAYLRNISDRIKVNFINRPDVADQLTEYIEYSCAKMIFYGHDVHYLRLKRQYEITGDKIIEAEYKRMESVEAKYICTADTVGYPSFDEVKMLKNKYPSANIEYFPLYSFGSCPVTQIDDCRKGIIFVGGFGHKPNEDGVIWFITSVLPILKEKGFKDKVFLVGSNPSETVCALANSQVEVTGYISDEKLKEYYNKSRVAIIPLRYGAGMKGKLLEAMYNGLPVVTTSVGAEGLKDNENCMVIADEERDFAERLFRIYFDNDSLNEFSQLAQMYIMEHFGKRAIRDCLIKAIGNI